MAKESIFKKAQREWSKPVRGAPLDFQEAIDECIMSGADVLITNHVEGPEDLQVVEVKARVGNYTNTGHFARAMDQLRGCVEQEEGAPAAVKA